MHAHLVRWALFAALVTPTVLVAQQRRITGTVTDVDNGQPIAGAVITARGGRGFAQAGDDGRFAILVDPVPVRLLARAVGYAPAEVPVGVADSVVAIKLKNDPLQLEAVVVTGQATGVERRLATTSTSRVTGDQVNTVPAASVDKALQGKIAGANIQTNSGAPGGGAQIQIRGINTILGASDPLIVVDGVIYSNATVASGLYTVTGSGSAAGTGPAQDDADNRLADLNPEDIASVEVLKSAAASSIYGSKAANGVIIITTKRGLGGKPHATITQRVGFSNLLRGPGVRAFDTTSAFDLYNSPEDSAVIRSLEVNGQLPVYDHLQEAAGNKPLSYETSLDVSGGNDNTKYFISGDWSHQGGIINNTDAGRQSLRVNLDQRLAEKLMLNLSTAFTRTTTDRGMTNNDNSGAGITYALAYIPSFVPLLPVKGVYPQPAFTYQNANPLQTIALGSNAEAVDRFTGGATLTYQALEAGKHDLKFVGGAGGDLFNQKNTVYAPPDLYFESPQQFPGVSTLGNADSRYVNWNLNVIDKFTPSGPSTSFTTSAGLQYEDRQLNQARSTAQGLLEGQSNIDQGAVFGQPFELNTHEKTFAMYAQEQLQMFDERLLAEVGLRAERSSVFGNTNQYFIYPKVSAAYRFPDLLGSGSDFKLRGAYGETGNQPLFGQKFTTLVGGVNIGGNVGTQVGSIAGSPDIEPERVKEFEAGLDASPFHGRATLEFTWYVRHTTNLLLARTPPPASGYSEVITNGGELRNSGIEIALGVAAIQRHDFSWTVHSTFARTRSLVEQLPGTGFSPPTAGFGLAFGEYFVQQGRPIDQIIGQTSINPDGSFNVTYMGHASPDFDWSMGNDFTYKRFFLTSLWDWQSGGVAQNQTLSLYDCNLLAPDSGTPEGAARANDCFDGIATPYVQSTSFLKLREVSVGYTLPDNLAQKFFGSSEVRVELTGRNLLIFTNYFGYDPESSNYGQQAVTRNVDLGPYPPSRAFMFTITAGF
ncbi:MAG TPA: SusC/RagA family TonB-linked outer membrane protein [Gemmatimonadaceae bacterium]